MKVRFQEVAVWQERSGKCAVCGKYVKRRQKFYQTISPFNKNKYGQVKCQREILEELMDEVREYLSTPLKHAKCATAPQ